MEFPATSDGLPVSQYQLDGRLATCDVPLTGEVTARVQVTPTGAEAIVSCTMAGYLADADGKILPQGNLGASVRVPAGEQRSLWLVARNGGTPRAGVVTFHEVSKMAGDGAGRGRPRRGTGNRERAGGEA
jgi:hypothetical protein